MKCHAYGKRTHKPCKNNAVKGAEVCRLHGGKSPQVMEKIARKTQEEKARRTAQLLGVPVVTSPHEALENELHACAGLVQWLGDQIREQGEITHQTPQGEKATVWFRLYQQERDRLANVAEKCSRAGVEERRISLIEDQARMMSQLVSGILAELNIPIDDHAKRIIRRQFSLMPAMLKQEPTNVIEIVS